MDIKFHCAEESNFKTINQKVRAFVYTDYFIEAHNHDFYEMNIVLGGSGIHKIESSSFSVKRGDVFVIPPMTVHAYSDTEHLEVYHVLFKKDFIRSNQKESESADGFLQLMEIEPFLRQKCNEAMFLHLNPSQLDEILSDLKYLVDGGEFDSQENTPLNIHTAWKIVYYLSHLLNRQFKNEKKSPAKKYNTQIFEVLEYIHQHFSEKLTVQTLAQCVYLSRSTFLRNFIDVCGCSPATYIKRYRVKKAAELIEESEKSKTEIAHSVGFYDLSHMEKAIKALKDEVL